MRLTKLCIAFVISCLLVTLMLQPSYAIELPPPGSTAFIQTSAPQAGITVGDFYTNILGGNQPHTFKVFVPCAWPVGQPITFSLFDPEVGVPNPLGTMATDEIRGPSPTNNTQNMADADDTHFQLTAPGGAVVSQTFTPTGGTNGLWVELTTFAPSTPGFGCGAYTLTSRTGDIFSMPSNNSLQFNNDDNAWRLRVVSDPDCTLPADPCSGIGTAQSTLLDNGNQTEDADGRPGTGDELLIALSQTSFQHTSALASSCQDFFFFVDGTISPIRLNNFDMDQDVAPCNNPAICHITYFSPSGASTAGTVSNTRAWNNGTTTPPPQRVGDLIPIGANDIGWWRAQICVNDQNQYIFEAQDGLPFFYQQPPTPNMIVTKDDGLTVVSSTGQTVTYTITYRNTGSGAVIRAVLTDTLPAGATFVGCTGGCTMAAGTVTWTLGTVPATPNPGSSGSLQLTVNLPAAVPPTTHVNTGSITYTDLLGNIYPPPTATDVDTVTATANLADISLQKTDVQDPIILGRNITYILTVTNNGPSPADNVVVTDTLPAGVTFISATPSAGTCGAPAGGVFTCNLGTLVFPGGNAITVVVTPAAAGSMTNTASVTSTSPDNTPGNNQDTETTTINPQPLANADVSLQKTDVQDPITSGGNVTDIITVTNNGPDTADNVIVTDTLPAGVTFVSATPSAGTCSAPAGRVFTCNLGMLAFPGNATITVVVTPTAAGSLTNTASVTSTTPDNTPGNNQDTETTTINPPTPGTADLSLRKTDAQDPVPLGSNANYTITVTNNGPYTAQNVVVAENLPGAATFVSAAPSMGTCNAPLGGIFICALGTLANGQVVTIQVVIMPQSPGGLVNGASVGSSTSDNSPGNNGDSQTTAVVPPRTPLVPAKPELHKSVDIPFAKPGDVITWTITVTNPNVGPITNITVTDNLPSELEPLSASASDGAVTLNGQQMTFTMKTLAGGQTVTISIRTRIRPTVMVPFVINNLASLTSSLGSVTTGKAATSHVDPPFKVTSGASVVSVTRLPSTGETPWWRLPLLVLLVGSGGVSAGWLIGRRLFRRII